MTLPKRRPAFIEGVMVAAVLSISGGSLHLLLRLIASPWEARTLSIAAVGFGYLLYLLWRSPEPAGRISIALLWAGVTLAVLLLIPSWTLPVQLALLWITRVLYLQRGFSAAVLDLGLVMIGLGGGLWAITGTGSLAAAIWSFFLIQAPFAAAGDLLPHHGSAGESSRDPGDDFERAERSAASNLRRLAQADGRR
ncbi:MAG: hypothetical protein WBG92_07140 [Thiohalocapsa sp.]